MTELLHLAQAIAVLGGCTVAIAVSVAVAWQHGQQLERGGRIHDRPRCGGHVVPARHARRAVRP